MSSASTYDTKISADPADFLVGFRRAVAGAKDSSAQIKESVSGISETFEGLQGLIAGFGALLGGGLAGEFVKFNAELQDQFSKSAQAAGVTTEQFSGMAYAARLADVDTENLSKAYVKLGQALTNAQQGQKLQVELFKQLKLDPSKFKDTDELLGAVADRFANMADGAAKTSLAVDLFGERIGPQLIPMLDEGRDGLEQLKQEAADLGVVVSTEAGERAEKFNDTLTRLGQAARGASMRISDQLIPVLQRVADEVGNIKGVGDTVGQALRTVIETVTVLAANVKFVFDGIGRDLGAFAAQARVLFTDFSGSPLLVAYAALKEQITGIKDIRLEKFHVIEDAVEADDKAARAKIDAFSAHVLGLQSSAGGGRGSVNPETVKPDEFVPGAKPSQVKHKAVDKSQMPLFESALEAERRGYAEMDALHGMSKQAELDYWNGILSTAKLSEADRVAVAKQAAQARVRVLQDEAQKAQQLQGISLQDWQTAELAKVTQDEDAAKTRVALGQETQAQLLAQQQQFEDRRHAIQLAALQADLATLDPQRDPVKVAQVNSKIEALEQTHQLKLAQIRSQVAVQSAAQQKAIWDSLGQSINTLWNNGVQALMNGTLTWANAMRAVGTELVGWFANSVVEPMVVKAIFGEQAKTAATAAGTAERWAIESAAAAKSMALWAATAIKNIMTSAWEAMAAAWKAIVGIPYVGPVLAPIAAGAAFAGVSALAGNVASAAGGYDIPATINPFVQAHAREMILPATLADKVRNMTDGGGSGGLTVHVHHNIQALDGASVKRVLVDNPDAVAAAVQKAVRHFHLIR
jgi:hypothetical protein